MRDLPPGPEQNHVLIELASVGEHAGHHEPALDQYLSVHSRLADLVPGGDDGLVVPERPLAVGDHGMLVERAGELVEGAQLTRRLAPATQPVKGEAVKLPDRRYLGRQPDEHPELGERLAVQVALIGARSAILSRR